ncbi:S-methyl-5-thioribose kinase [Neptunomonas sp. XY-337]|uniref:S-methyl-5-thioribose kinase n=1 Tax=Neptunomonas sp. XY-337 TaxID=2561897 RepID=UPI0010AA860E|nr:S-methyl-5-thioribose kinase [Neptunomonas sp. XY-337]
MTAPQPLNDQEIRAFVCRHTDVFQDEQMLQVEEISDGNINFVYRVGDGKNSVILKQALPYIRIIGEGWPLPVDRIRIEAQALGFFNMCSPNSSPDVLHFERSQHVILMEDIGDYHNLRHVLIRGDKPTSIGSQLGRFLAMLHYTSSDFLLDSIAKKCMVASYLNPQLCSISEEVYFLDPFCDHERNNVSQGVRSMAQALWQDDELKLGVAQLRYQFMNDAQVLLHGDLHTGSVFVTQSAFKVIDPEFAFYGPAGFDLGVLLANLLLSYASQVGKSHVVQRDETQAYLIDQIEQLVNSYFGEFDALLQAKINDPVLQQQGFDTLFLAGVRESAMGFAGIEMTRRTIGIAHVADLDEIEDDERKTLAEMLSLTLAASLIKQRTKLATTADLAALIKDCQASLPG